MSDIVWSDPEWLQFFPLNAFTVLDYFARSSFYDVNCNNEKLRQQGLDLSKLPYVPCYQTTHPSRTMPSKNRSSILWFDYRVQCLRHAHCDVRCVLMRRTLHPGIEFVIHDTQEPHLYVIRKQHRDSPSAVTPLGFFYVLDGRVYQAPTLHASVVSRLVSPAQVENSIVHLLLARSVADAISLL